MTIDASGATLGRLATQIASALRGKHRPDFDPSNPPPVAVSITNAKALRFTGKKYSNDVRYRHSGYPGGLKTMKLRDLFERSPENVIRMAVSRMLPKNSLRTKLLKRLTFVR